MMHHDSLEPTAIRFTVVEKSLHGQYYALLNKNPIDKSRSMCWLKSHVHSESESTILAIQDHHQSYSR